MSAGNARRRGAGIVAGVLAIAALAIGALHSHRPARPATVSSATQTAPAAALVGAIDAPAADTVVGPRVTISGWALAPGGVARVVIRSGDRTYVARTGLPRPDVAASKPRDAHAARSGFEFAHDFSADALPPGWDRRTLSIVAVAPDGREAPLGSRTVIEPAALSRWTRYASAPGEPFHLLPALSGVGIGTAAEIRPVYEPYLSPTTRIGMRVPILYLRTTRGRAADFDFDPGWDVERRCGARRIADDSLAALLADAKARRLPVLITLNGGVWADSACDAPEWDLNDHLEQQPGNCQWNEKNEVMRDDALASLPGSQHSPELARALTLNVYAQEVRRYKRRNLQQAGRLIAQFARDEPELFVGVNLDPDVYVLPFFEERQWYDYNPGTLRQFRHWLAGAGPYAGRPEPGVPDLSRYRRAKPLSLAAINALAGTRYARMADVDPPRAFPRDGARPFWRDPWVHEWETFRRHLVHLHHDELVGWLAEAGVAADRVWTSQGFIAPEGEAMPLAHRIDGAVRNYDSGGVSIEGAKPRGGHLGAILYGAAAANRSRTENARSLFDAFAAIDVGWGAVEFNTADLRRPREQPDEAAAYRALRDLWNYGARFVSPMAWNGSNGLFAAHPEYVPFTSWRNTPAENAARDFLLARAGLGRGARLWTFGTPRHADDDGWRARAGALQAQPASLRVTADATRTLVLESPHELRLKPRSEQKVVVLVEPAAPVALAVDGRAADTEAWKRLGSGDAATGVPIDTGAQPLDQLRLTFALPDGSTTITRIAIVPQQ